MRLLDLGHCQESPDLNGLCIHVYTVIEVYKIGRPGDCIEDTYVRQLTVEMSRWQI